jgi:two-component system, response regulator YesN
MNEPSSPATLVRELIAVSDARDFITNQLERSLCLDEVAGHVGVSPSYFDKLFERHTGMTLRDFVDKARMEEAKLLLQRPQARISEVAHGLGFRSLSEFNRSFYRVNAELPAQYRARQHSHLCAE